MNRSGVVHLIAEDDAGALDLCRRLLSFLPSNNLEEAPRLPYNLPRESDHALNHAVPVDAKIAYDVRTVISRVLDYQDFFEIQPGFAANVVIGFGRIQGRSVGIVANQPNVLAGVLDIDASDKVARFVRFCNAFNTPLVTFVDTPGFSARHRARIRRHYSTRCEDALRLLGCDGPKNNDHPAQGLRWRLHRDVQQRVGSRSRSGVADSGDRGDGRRRRGGNRLPP